MNRSSSSRPEPSSNGIVLIDQAVFSQLYDQYAPALLGVIVATVRDEAQSIRALEATFVEIRLQYGRFKPESQPLFVWLLLIARRMALEAVKNQTETSSFALRLTDTGQVMGESADASASVRETQSPAVSPANKLLDAVLFRNCTPEEAASSAGLPVATARQQLRLAVQQLRTPGSV